MMIFKKEMVGTDCCFHGNSICSVSEPNSPISKTPLLRQPYLAPGTESASSQHSSRVGAGFSDTGSVSSAGSFQSAASQHSLQSDQSMHSFHSQQSHHSMQSVHNQQTHEVPMRSAYQPGMKIPFKLIVPSISDESYGERIGSCCGTGCLVNVNKSEFGC